ncbi:10836_t:CDS:2 [Funneliformis geosporum]|uniref:10836_t:CDS:1 n=1 Tax=Funneliformis geosporum TaxID=1117311 RepID=A0A9W4SCR2_9GLOM|nr:10836_t:CDS:2 [Funneliformis geosporum]
MSESLKELTSADWINRSWNAVDISLIQRSFKCYSISNKRDGTEDDWIFNYEHLEQAKSNDEVEILDDINEDDRSNDINDNHYEEGDYDNEWI